MAIGKYRQMKEDSLGSHMDMQAIIGFDLDRRDRSFTFRMREILKLFTTLLGMDLRSYGVTAGQWQFLRALWELDGRSQRELGEELNITSAATVFAVNILERDGLATREPDPDDSRRSLIFLTLKGHQLRGQLKPFARQIHMDAFEGFSNEDISQLDILLGRLKDNLEGTLKRRKVKIGSKRAGGTRKRSRNNAAKPDK